MTAEQLRAAGIRLFGKERGWMTRFADRLGIDRSNLSRWLSGTVTVPGPVAACVEAWLALAKLKKWTP